MSLNQSITHGKGEVRMKLMPCIKKLFRWIEKIDFKSTGIYCPQCGKRMQMDYVRCKAVCLNCYFEFKD